MTGVQRKMKAGEVDWLWVENDALVILDPWPSPPAVVDVLRRTEQTLGEWHCIFLGSSHI
jgi:hypothetical protein